VWEKYLQFHKKFNPTRSAYKAPIMVGYNIIGFDMPITERLCQKFGPTYKDRGALFNPIHRYDVFDMFEGYTENNPNITSMKLSDCAEWVGIKIDKDKTHDALYDVQITANIFFKLMQFQREISKQTDFSRAFAGKNLII
jgi:DNA polymerase III epsilon subunit-like protein